MSELPTTGPAVILLVEDDEDDILLTQETFRDAGVAEHLLVVRDGDEALDFLYRRPPYEDAPRPDVILLDLNLPRKDGRQVLAEIKTDPDLLGIPVAVLTGSAAEEDILLAYSLHASCYLRKPLRVEHVIKVMHRVPCGCADTACLSAQ